MQLATRHSKITKCMLELEKESEGLMRGLVEL